MGLEVEISALVQLRISDHQKLDGVRLVLETIGDTRYQMVSDLTPDDAADLGAALIAAAAEARKRSSR